MRQTVGNIKYLNNDGHARNVSKFVREKNIYLTGLLRVVIKFHSALLNYLFILSERKWITVPS